MEQEVMGIEDLIGVAPRANGKPPRRTRSDKGIPKGPKPVPVPRGAITAEQKDELEACAEDLHKARITLARAEARWQELLDGLTRGA